MSIEKRATPLDFFKKLPVYYSFEAAAEGVSRKETVDDLLAFRLAVGGEPIVSPSLVQRLDYRPQLQLPLYFFGVSVTASAAGRVTYYSNSIDPTNRAIKKKNITRGYGQELDVRPRHCSKISIAAMAASSSATDRALHYLPPNCYPAISIASSGLTMWTQWPIPTR